MGEGVPDSSVVVFFESCFYLFFFLDVESSFYKPSFISYPYMSK